MILSCNQPASPAAPRSGFTLIEVLVVITIIIVIAAISAVGITKWSRRAKAVSSITKVRDIGVSVISYTTERGELPVWHDYTRGMYWWQLIAEAEDSDDPERFKSPGDSGFDRENPAQTLSYGWNYPVIGRHKGDSGYRGDHVLRLTSFYEPSETLVLADGPATNCWGFIDGYENQPDPERYDGKAAAVFLDGSARLLDTPRDFQPDSKWFDPVQPLLPR